MKNKRGRNAMEEKLATKDVQVQASTKKEKFEWPFAIFHATSVIFLFT